MGREGQGSWRPTAGLSASKGVDGESCPAGVRTRELSSLAGIWGSPRCRASRAVSTHVPARLEGGQKGGESTGDVPRAAPSPSPKQAECGTPVPYNAAAPPGGLWGRSRGGTSSFSAHLSLPHPGAPGPYLVGAGTASSIFLPQLRSPFSRCITPRPPRSSRLGLAGSGTPPALLPTSRPPTALGIAAQSRLGPANPPRAVGGPGGVRDQPPCGWGELAPPEARL